MGMKGLVFYVLYKPNSLAQIISVINWQGYHFWSSLIWGEGDIVKTRGHYIYIYIRAIGLISRVFAYGLEDWGLIPGLGIPRTQKTVLDAAFLNSQHYKVRIKGKSGAIQGKVKRPHLHLSVVAIEKGAFRLLHNYGCQIWTTYIYIYI